MITIEIVWADQVVERIETPDPEHALRVVADAMRDNYDIRIFTPGVAPIAENTSPI